MSDLPRKPPSPGARRLKTWQPQFQIHQQQGKIMRLDIYRRSERGGVFSYLAVPAGKRLPEEVTNTDWESEARGFNFNEDEKNELPDFSITNPTQQIKDKGYAITSSQIRR